MISATIPEGTLKAALSRQSESWVFIKDPSDKRKVVFHYESLQPKYKSLILAKYGDPYLYAKNCIKDQVINSPEDYAAFIKKGYIPEVVINSYTRIAAWLRFLEAVEYKKYGYPSKPQFYDACIKAINLENLKHFKVNNLRVVQRKLKKWREKGLECIIRPEYNNQNAVKLGTEQKEFIRFLYRKHNKLPVSVIYTLFLNQARKANWPEVSDVTVYNYINAPEVQMDLTAERRGMEEWRNKYDPIVNRKKPSFPNAMWVMDGTPVEIYYQETLVTPEGKKTNYNKRLYGYLVVDAHSWKIVGFAMGETESGEMVAMALKNACCDNNVLPHQLLFDNSSANKSQTALIEAVSRFHIPAKVGNARTKVIEAIQAHFNRHILKLHDFHSGGNITAKKQDTHANREWLQVHKKETPTKMKAIQDFQTAIQLWNGHLIESWDAIPNQLYEKQSPRNLPLSDTMRLSLFGTWRDPHQYTNEGLRLQINGQRIIYWVDDQDFYYKSVGKTFNVKYDPQNLSAVAIYEGNTLVNVAYTKDLPPMALIDFEEGDRAKLNKILVFKKDTKDKMAARARLDAEGYLKAPISIDGVFKDYLNSAEGDIKQAQIQEACVSSEDELFNLYDADLAIGTVYGAAND